jgi:amino acid adenylation domain-containing protein
VRQLVTEEGKAPFDLSNGPLLRVKLLRLATDEYVVLLTMHHIIGDGWSMGLLVNEIGSLYQAFTNDLPSPLPELPIQYADYAVWQRDWLEGEVLEEELRYWRKQLGGELPVLELPADRARPAVESYKGAYHSVEFSQHITSGVKELSQRHGCTLYMTLLAAFNTLLYRYSGQDDIITGTAIAGRNRAEVEPLIGLFVNSLAMRTDLSGDPTFVQLLGRVREMALGAYAHQDVPFEKLVEELNPVRDLSRSPLYQVMLILQNEPSADVLNLSGGTPRTRAGEIGTAKMDLLLSLFERSGKLLGHIEYNTDLFDAATIERTLGHFENLLRTIPELAQRPISELQILSDEEREQLLVTWNTARTDFPPDRNLHQLFEDQAKRTPQAAAVAFGPQQLTYAELNARANQVAHHLRSLGVGAETRVGIYLERGIEMIVALLGIMKAGGAYVPIDPQVPQARLEFMLADADVTVLVTQQELSSSTAGTTIVFLDADWSNIAALPATDLQQASSADNLAYVIYTSGSTGLPKGVMVPHRNVVALVNALLPRLDVKDRDVWTLVHSIAFDFSVWEIWGALLSGAKLVVVPELIVSSPAEFEELLRREQVTVINQTPSAAAQLLGAGNGDSWQARGSAVKQVFVGGEALSADLAHSLIAMGAPVWNFYGPTEATVWAALKLLSADDEEVTVGRPISNWQLYVLDHRHELLPVGVPGELYIGGEGLARGYLNRADLTAEKFIPNPYGGSARLYRTGDVARYKPNGEIEFVGRADHQVKLRGYRIELGEVEAALLEHPQVREAVALVRERQSGDRQLVAYVATGELPANEETVNSRVLIELVRKALPKYMVPATVVVMDQLPRTSNGKIDRKALPEPDYTTASECEFVGARTSLEEILVGIWEQVLSVGHVSVHNNFFDLGGHSLLATQVVSRIRETFGVNLSLRSLFEHQTIARLSGAVESLMRQDEGPEAPPLRPVERDRALPLSFAQQRLWFLDQLEPQKAIYNYSSAVRLRGPLDLEALERTLTEIVRRHEVLRTTFQSIDGEVVQVISPPQPVKLEVVDITSWPEAHREAEARRRISEEAAQPFNLSDGPLLRFKLLKTDDEDHTIALTMHHIISDRWSVGILIKEVSAIYQAFIKGQSSPLPELPVQYADYAVWQREWLKGEVLEKEIDYWRQQLGGALSELRLPVVRQRPAVPSYRGAYHSFRLEPTLSSSLKHLSREQGCTLFMTLLAAFQTLIYRYTQQDDILVGTTIAGRNRTELENLIGFFVNTLPMRADLSGEPSFIDLLKRVREFALGAYVHQELPFEKLVEELHPERGPDSALVRVFFGLQNAPATSLELPGLKLNAVGYSSDAVRFDLTLWMEEGPGGLTGTWTYSTDVLDSAAIAQMHERFETLLQSIVDKPETTLRLLDIIGPTERMQKAASRSERESRNAEKLTLKKRKAVAMGTEPQT